MPSKPYFPLFFADFKKDTSRLTHEEKYAYLLLLNDYWDTEKPIPNDKKVLEMITNLDQKTFKKVWQKLIQLFEEKDGLLYQKRMEKEIKYFHEQASKRSSKAKSAANARWHKECSEQCSEHSMEECSEVCPSDATSTSYSTTYSSSSSKIKDLSNDKSMSGKPDADPPKNSEFKSQAVEVLNFLNEKTGKHYRAVDANLKLIMARLKSGASVQDCKSVIAKKRREWVCDPKMVDYLRPATLFNATKFEQYVGELFFGEQESVNAHNAQM